LPFGRVAHDSQGVLAAIDWDAFMTIKGGGNLSHGISGDGLIRSKLGAAPLTDAKSAGAGFDDSELSLRHVSSLPLLENTCRPVDFKRHHYRELLKGTKDFEFYYFRRWNDEAKYLCHSWGCGSQQVRFTKKTASPELARTIHPKDKT
jgi:hypothetical protein